MRLLSPIVTDREISFDLELPGEVVALTGCNLLEELFGSELPIAGRKASLSLRPHEIASWYCRVKR
jgi:hypothetical protein